MGSCMLDNPISCVNQLGLLPFIIFDAKGKNHHGQVKADESIIQLNGR